MRIFLYKLGVFFAAAVTFLSLGFYFYYYESDVMELYGYKVYHSLIKSQNKTNNVKTLILGDSAARQAYDNYTYNNDTYSLASNQAISMAGQYLLLRNFLEVYDTPKELTVILIYRPSSFANDLDQKYTYQYFLKPFYNKKNIPYLTDYSFSKISKVPFNNLVNLNFIKNSNWSPPYYMGNNDFLKFDISKTSEEYLVKMKELCDSYQVKSFYLKCSFLSNNISESDINLFQTRIDELNLTEIFQGYFKEIPFFDKDLFSDGIHLRKDVIPYDFLELTN